MEMIFHGLGGGVNYRDGYSAKRRIFQNSICYDVIVNIIKSSLGKPLFESRILSGNQLI